MKRVRYTRQTLLVVGEGDCEEAFLKYLREVYCSGGKGVSVTIRNAHGKGPENVINYTVKQALNADYDQCVAFLDTDLPWTSGTVNKANKAKIVMVGSTPCLEGLLLAILSHPTPLQSTQCKKTIAPLLGVNTDLTDRTHYAKHFPKSLLEKRRLSIPSLHQLLEYFEGHW